MEIISSIIGSLASLCTVYPTEVYKRALHLNTHLPLQQRRTHIAILRSLFPFGFYKGFLSCAIGTVPKNAFPLFAFPITEKKVQNLFGENLLSSLITGATLSSMVTLLTSPTENLSLRKSNYPNDSLIGYLRNGGYKTLYVGFSGFLMMDFVRIGIKFSLYSRILSYVKPYTSSESIGWLPQAVSGGLASSLVAVFTNPIDVAHTKFRSDYTSSRYNNSFTKALMSTRIQDLYCGFTVRALRGIPGGFVMFGVNEFAKTKLS